MVKQESIYKTTWYNHFFFILLHCNEVAMCQLAFTLVTEKMVGPICITRSALIAKCCQHNSARIEFKKSNSI